MVRENADDPRPMIPSLSTEPMRPSRSENAGQSAVSRSFAGFIARQRISGAVGLVACGDEILHFSAVGLSDLQSARPMKPDDVFWVASMTKPIGAAAVLMLADEGRIALDDPVEKYLPECADHEAAVPPRRSITIRDLLRHTHGLTDIPTPHCEATLAGHVRAIASAPRVYAPGARWEYGNAGANTAGRVAEVVSGQSFQDFLQIRFFDPLGMKDTTFFPRAAQRDRLAKMYAPGAADPALVETERVMLPGDLWSEKRTVFPGGGLFSTAPDMRSFFQMLADGGISHGRRFLSEDAVQEMIQSQTGGLATTAEGCAYGLGVHRIEKPAGEFASVSPGTWGHDGASGTSAFYDPRRKLLMIQMIQRTGLWGTPSEGGAMRKAFQEAAISMAEAGEG